MDCKQATQLLSEKMDRPLTQKEKVALKVHTTMCRGCRQFSAQMEDLRFISRCYTKGDDKNEKK